MSDFSKPLQHNTASHFRYQTTDRPWHGPTRRAKEALAQFTGEQAVSMQGFLDFIQSHHTSIYESLEWVTFYRFKSDKSKGLDELRIAVINLQPNPRVRDLLFEIRETITAATGWYPLVMGSRALSRQPYYRLIQAKVGANKISKPFEATIGRLIAIKDISNTNGENGLLLCGEHGSILLDAGCRVDLEDLRAIRYIFLSHFHRDHAGDIWQTANLTNVPVILSETTLASLWAVAPARPTEKERLTARSYIVESPAFTINCDGRFETFPVFHAPGSYGLRVADDAGCSVFYLGDCCLRNGFLDKSDELLQRITREQARHRWVIIDAALANKTALQSADEDTPQKLLNSYASNTRNGTAFFVSMNTESLVYAFVLAFYLTRDPVGKPIKMFLSRNLYELTRQLIRPVLFHNSKFTDPFVNKLLGTNIVNFIESQRVYPLPAIDLASPDEPAVVFSSPKELFDRTAASRRLLDSDVILTGRQASDATIIEKIQSYRPRSIIEANSPDWYFHSNEDDLVRLIKALTEQNIHIVLFHQSAHNLRQFIARNQLQPNLVHVAARNTIPLRV